MGRYAHEFDRSLSDPEGFWGDAAKNLDWYQAPSVVLDASSPPFYRWLADGTLNTCFNALDRHVRDGRGNQAALIYDSPVTGACQTLTYRQLLDQVARFKIGMYSRTRLTSIPQDADTMTLGAASSMRAASSGAAKPPNTTECTAPMRAQASMAMTASGIIGM